MGVDPVEAVRDGIEGCSVQGQVRDLQLFRIVVYSMFLQVLGWALVVLPFYLSLAVGA